MGYKINKIKNKLDIVINNDNLKNTLKYRKCAKLFKMLINELIKEILIKHKNKLLIEVNGIKLSLEGSVLNSSSAFGYIVEEFIVREIKQSKYAKFFEYPIKTSDSVFDLKYKNNIVDLFCNIKVEKIGEYKLGEKTPNSNGTANNAVASAESLIKEYQTNSAKPKLYLITKIPYAIDIITSEVLLSNKTINTFIESFILKFVKVDGRSWTKGKGKKTSGRLQTPTKTNLKYYNINTIPNYNSISKKMCNLEKYL